MNIEMHGKKIEAVCWPDSENKSGEILPSGNRYGELTLSATHHGDRDEFWIIQTKDGKEIARYNTKYVESIVWEEE